MNSYDILRECKNEQEILANINKLSLVTILEERKLSLNFVVDVILNKKFQILTEEQDIDIALVTTLQPHLNYQDIFNLFKKKYIN